MITFETLTITNFMSVGNAPLVIDYTSNKSTLVTATNGSGKSSVMMDSICFALYGKPYRNINKPQLLNSINGKNCLVEIKFSVGKTKYTVKRGIKPALFEIYKNGVLLNQDAASRDYQKVLEQSILKMNYRTFTQVVIMGSGNYVPFMRLKSNERREFIEDVLDIKIFSIMNQLLKQHMKDTDDQEKAIKHTIDLLKEKATMQQSFIATLEKEKQTRTSEIQFQIDSMSAEIIILNDKIELLSEQADTLGDSAKDLSKIQTKMKDLVSIQSKIQKNIEKNTADKDFYSSIEVCPTCHQTVEDHHREKIIGKVDDKLNEFQKGLINVEAVMADINREVEDVEARQKELQKIQGEIGTSQSSIAVAQRLVQNYQRDMADLLTNSASVDAERDKLKVISKEIVAKDKQRKEVVIQQEYNDATASLLKDTGIKTKIIKQYVPVFNKLINTYLSHLDLFVSFELDENFNETVKSRYRDSFTYDSFSEGEKQRIDLAMLFTFREIARMKNAINVNLLIMDEVLDQSLDGIGVENFFNIIGSLSSTNLFVISHRENMGDKFDAHMKLSKPNNFTVLDIN